MTTRGFAVQQRSQTQHKGSKMVTATQHIRALGHLASYSVPSATTFTPVQCLELRRQRGRQGRQQRMQTMSAGAVENILSIVSESPLRDVLATVFAAVGSKMLVRFFYMLEAWETIDQNTSRKLVHTLAGPLFMVTWPLFSTASYAQYIAALVPALNIARLLLVGYGLREDKRAIAAMSRTGDAKELLRGPLYYTLVLFAVVCLYWRTSSVGLIIICLMCGGDGLADLVGRRWGKSNRLPWNSDKSWAGSLAMLTGGFSFSMAFILLFSQLGYFDISLPSMALTVGLISLAATAIESLPVNTVMDDNLTVPGVAAVMGFMMLQVAVEVL